MRVDKYLYYQYTTEVEKILSGTELSILDRTKIQLIKENCFDSPFYYIIEDLYKLIKNDIPTVQLSNIYNTGVRNIQIWLKTMGLNRSITKGRKLIKNKEIKNMTSTMSFNEELMKNKKYCLYRFLDKDKNVLYIGKCERSIHSNGHGGTKEYFVKDRLTQHYSPSSKQIPKSLYLNTIYIEICFPDVNSGQELEILESQLISYYERNKFQCNYNLYILNGINYIEEDNMNWMLYDKKSSRDIKTLKKRYGYGEIPPIETTNERLRALSWVINKNKLKIN